MNRADLDSRILPSLLAGASRQPLAGEALPMLSLMGQALRFDRPATPDSFAVEAEIKDERTILADRLRRPLIRLLTAKTGTGHPARALARAFDEMRLRPHPFDLPAIDGFVRSYAEKLGPTARHWAEMQKSGAETRSYFDAESLDDSNWTMGTLSRRAKYLDQRRREDAAAARGLVESSWPQEEAEARFRLLQALETGLTAADQPFLSTLEKDRAPRLRALAARFLARLGTGGENAALRACLERIEQSQSGLLRKRTVLKLELPANVKDDVAWRWVLQTFREVSLSELAGAFQLTERELIEAAVKDEVLLFAMALMATAERRLDLLEIVAADLPGAWERMFVSGLDTLGAMTKEERHRWEEIVVGPYRQDPPVMYALWDWLHRITDTEAADSTMSAVLDAKLLTTVPEHERGSAPWLELIAAMCPAAQRNRLREQLAEFDQSATLLPLALLDILEGMENSLRHV